MGITGSPPQGKEPVIFAGHNRNPLARQGSTALHFPHNQKASRPSPPFGAMGAEKGDQMNLIKKWNEYMGPKDERLEKESNRYMRISYYILLVGTVLCAYYAIMLEQVSDTTDTPIFTAVGQSVVPVQAGLIVVILLSCFIPLAMEIRAGILSEHSRYASVDHVPWDLVSLLALFCGLGLGVLTTLMRVLAEVQIVGVGNVTWLGDIAMGVVYFGMAFVLAFILTAATFRDAIKRRQQLDSELEY